MHKLARSGNVLSNTSLYPIEGIIPEKNAKLDMETWGQCVNDV